jgi:hypothetical protein
MNFFGAAKLLTDLVVSAGVGSVVGNAIKASIPLEAKIIQRISIGIGGFVLSGMVGDFASKYAREKLEEFVTQIKETKTSIAELRNH